MEGFGRKVPEKDVRRDINNQIEEADKDILDRIKKRIIRSIEIVDKEQKALTGRKVEDYVLESGVAREELFPEDGKILNIGDPWQTLDLEGVTNVDYELGEEAEFQYNEEEFLKKAEDYIKNIEVFCNRLINNRKGLVTAINLAQEQLKELMTNLEIENYPKLSELSGYIVELINKEKKEHSSDMGDSENDLKNLWYDVNKLQRGFADIYLVKKVIEPAIEEEMIKNRGITEEQKERIIKNLVQEYRFIKKYKQAEMVKAAFPDMPFEDKQFDRLIASWSISTHMFPVMEKREFDVYWDEIDRLLKKDGVAYIWPIYRGNEGNMEASLIDYRNKYGDAAVVKYEYDQEDNIEGRTISWVGNNDFMYTLEEADLLIIFPRHSSSNSKERATETMKPTPVF